MFCKEFMFLSSFRFIAKLRGKYREYLCSLCFCTVSPTMNGMSATLVAVDEPVFSTVLVYLMVCS